MLPQGLWPTRILCPWDSPGKNAGAGSHSLLRGIFPTQRLNSGLLLCRQILYHLSHQKKFISLPTLEYWGDCPINYRYLTSLGNVGSLMVEIFNVGGQLL